MTHVLTTKRKEEPGTQRRPGLTSLQGKESRGGPGGECRGAGRGQQAPLHPAFGAAGIPPAAGGDRSVCGRPKGCLFSRPPWEGPAPSAARASPQRLPAPWWPWPAGWLQRRVPPSSRKGPSKQAFLGVRGQPRSPGRSCWHRAAPRLRGPQGGTPQGGHVCPPCRLSKDTEKAHPRPWPAGGS